MKITWEITKEKRGRQRPDLHYKIEWEEWEKDLDPKVAHLGSNHPSSPLLPHLEAYQGEYYERLPWRAGDPPAYPEIEEGFQELQRLHEEAIKEAYALVPFELSGEIDTSPEIKRHVAPGICKDRMLSAVGESS